MKLAIMGDVHGKIKQMYDSVSYVEQAFGKNIDAVLQVGDFQAVRDEKDLARMAIPGKYKVTGDYPDYHNEGVVPKRTFFIGGNHDNDHWHREHPEGHELVEGLSYLGRSGVMDLSGTNVAWISGNYSEQSFEGIRKGKKKNKYHHFTLDDVGKVLKSGEAIDILLLHEWPSIRELSDYIDAGSVKDAENLDHALKRDVGVRELSDVVKQLKPRYVFAGHQHTDLDLDLDFAGSKTKFVALGKVQSPETSFYVLDTDLDKGGRYHLTFDEGGLSDYIQRDSRLRDAFNFLDMDCLDDAAERFMPLIEDASSETRALANYGIGVSLFRNLDPSDVDSSIDYFRRSLGDLELADTHLMLSHALQKKIAPLLYDSPQNDVGKLEGLLDQSLHALSRATELNPSLASQTEPSSIYLNRVLAKIRN
jgi:lariat debranching enzyme